MKLFHDFQCESLLITACILAVIGSTSPVQAATQTQPSDSVKTQDKVDKKTIKLAKATTAVIKTAKEDAEKEEATPLSVSISIGTSVGIGSFVSGPTQQVSISTGITPTISYKLADKMSLSAAIGGSIYHVNAYGSAAFNGQFLIGDAYATFSHSSLFKDADSGFNLSGALRLYFPTSLSSRFQNRILSVRPSFTGSIKTGPVSFSFTTMFTKYFNTSTTRSIDCGDNFDEGLCIEGRGPGVGGGFESEVKGGEVFLPSAGINSFYVGNGLNATWTIVDGLTLGASVTVYNLFGYRSYDVDEYSSENAQPGRSQVDRLITGIDLGYQINKKLSMSLGFSTDTIRPFGADGKDLVVLDLSRASDNISAVGLSFAGSL
jgi:hypothetical protein